MKAEELLILLAKKLDHESLAFDEAGLCRFTVGKEIKLTLERSLDEGAFFLYAPIGLMPIRLKEQCEVQKKLLAGNLFNHGTGHASLGFDPDSNLIILFQEFQEVNIEPSDFVNEFELFIGFIEFWKEEVAASQAESLKGDHRLNDPNIDYVRGKNLQILMV